MGRTAWGLTAAVTVARLAKAPSAAGIRYRPANSARLPSREGSLPAPRFQHGFANDVFISYTHEDDYQEDGVHWVARFEAELRARLAKVSGQSILTWRDDRLTGSDRFKPEIEEQLFKSAVLVPIVTPSYFHSEWCGAERGKFIERAHAFGGLDVGNKARIVKAAKTRVPLSHYPQELRELLEFRFYVEEPNGTAREFHLSTDPAVRRRFNTVVDDLAQAIDKILRGLEAGVQPGSKGFVYLAETSRDIDAGRDQLRRSLVHRGYTVLPEAPLRLHTGPEAEQLVVRDLAQCRLAVYPIGAAYGPILEECDRSITELQLDTALRDTRDGAFVRMVWVPARIEVVDQRQQQLLGRVRSELPSKGFEILEGPLTEIETHVTDRLERPVAVADASEDDDDEDRPEIYLMCLAADRDAARPVRDWLFAAGFEVRLPPTTDEAYAALHTRRLETADAFVIFWGSADESWLEPLLTELKRAKGLRKGKPILSKAIVLADPATPEKRDYLTRQATLVHGFSPTPLAEALQPLLAELKRVAPGSAV